MNYSIIAACGLILTVFSAQADRFADVQIKETALGSNIYMLSGAGGNMATFVAGDEVLLIDSQYAELAEKIRSKVLQLSAGKPLSRLINTHVHGDHVGSNAALSAGVDIIAHQNVLIRLQQDGAFPTAGLPTTTFIEQLRLRMNGMTVRLDAMPASHTDGDIVVWFEEANIVHMGDLLFEGRFPFIDTSKGGSVKGYINNTRQLINMLNDTTKVIPGHGNLTDKAGVQRSLAMMEATLAIVNEFKAQGMTEQQAVDKGLGEQWKKWHWNFITEERWIKTLYHADVN
ncbi:MBL fold metallo-hydrolase [Rheinheimera baltica]|uniref:MBL fold metallo-hydrolase n=1 Tax=Rheinheimera baltica TaxID=67576 RepID=UPI00273F08E2|nr:MBL fold metallo-hydrolase [Rheinheimera baltica]MDP5144415.1 MBL fold metallo-hydrolase [Rheinheimera baltica]